MRRLLYISLLLLVLLPCTAAEPVDTIHLATMMENRQYEEVLQLTTRELKRFPKSGAMYYYRCQANAYLGIMNDAMEDLNKAIRYHRDVPMALPDLYVMRAGMYLLIDDTVAALTDYTMAIQTAVSIRATASTTSVVPRPTPILISMQRPPTTTNRPVASSRRMPNCNSSWHAIWHSQAN